MTLLAYLEGSPSDAVMKFATSEDGITWDLGSTPDAHDTVNIWTSPIVANTSRAVIGNDFFFGAVAREPFDLIVQSDDVGQTWNQTVADAEMPQTAFGESFWLIDSGGTMTSSILYMAGYWLRGTDFVEGLLLRSADGGVSFQLYQPGTLAGIAGHYAQGFTVIDASTAVFADGNVTRSQWRTTDVGATWSQSTLPGAVGTINNFVAAGSGVVFAIGQYITGGQTRPTLWKSTDSGASYSQTVDPFAGLSYPAFDGAPPGGHGGGSTQHPLIFGLGAGDGLTVLLAMAGNPSYSDAFRWFRFTNDGGTTWQACTYTTSPDQRDFGAPRQITLADDGTWIVIVTYNSTLNDGSNVQARAELWRGSPSGTTLDFTRHVDVTQYHENTGVTCAFGGVVNLVVTAAAGAIFAGTWVDTQMVPVFA